jgi:hypothetical protein
VLRVAGAAPAETPANPDYYDDDDEFVPASEKENFDVFDWQLCKVRESRRQTQTSGRSRLCLFIIVSLFLLRLLHSSPSLSPSYLLLFCLSVFFFPSSFCILGSSSYTYY